jgi:chemotaxis protein methyltransferase WspC
VSERDLLADIARVLHDTIGLSPTSIGTPAIARAVGERMVACGAADLAAYRTRLQPADPELQALIECVVVPETWFFRYPEAFVALGAIVAARETPARRDNVLRVLSAPCATGEEAYSIAMTLRDRGIAPDRMRIDALDVSRRAVALGTRAVYGAGSFRTADLGFRDRHCTHTAMGYVVSDAIRAAVTIAEANLVAPNFHAPSASYDVVFCRNLLIYLDRAAQARVLATLRRLLAPGGHLFVGPAEAAVATGNGFRDAGYRMAFAHRAVDQPLVTRVSAPARLAPARVPTRPARMPSVTATGRESIVRGDAIVTAAPETLATASALADAGRLGDAAAACERLLREHGATAAVYYLLGLVRDALGEPARAADCYRKTLFLDPGHADAAAHLAWLAEEQDHPAEAQRLRVRAQRLAARNAARGGGE